MIGILAACFLIPGYAAEAARLAQDSVPSEVLRTLAEVVIEDSTALHVFWAGLERSGAPIVEAIQGDSTARLVTFVWRGSESTRNVAVITPHALIDIELARMSRLPGTDVWYRSYRMRADASMVYRFGPGDSLVPFTRERNLGERMSRWQLDPLNDETWTFGDGTRASVVRLADPSSPMGVGAIRGKGTVSATTVPGSGVWPDQTVSVYTPPAPEVDATDRPLVVLMDGAVYLRPMRIDSVLDGLIGLDADRQPVVVLVPADPASRTRQYDCNPAWSDYLANTLVPWAEDRYGTSDRSRDRIVGGYSLGGLAAACAAVRHPGTFGNVLAQSGSFYRFLDSDEPEALARRLAADSPLPIRWSLSIGLLETSAIPSSDPSMLTASRHLRDVLTAKGYAVQYREFYGGHEHVAWQDQLPHALLFLLRR